jgi:capsular polysaccharide transport system ATP-binding protein
MIELDRVSKAYALGSGGAKRIVENVSLRLARGRSVGLLGRNGSGKSTLLQMIGGAIEPDSGQIRRYANLSWPLGFGGGFHGALTGAQNTRFVARIYGVDTDDLLAAVEDFSELGPFMQMPVSVYSSGMKSRLAFAMSMAIDFDVYLVDEITAVGDSAFKKKCADAFAAKMDHADIIMVSHSVRTIRSYCQSGLVLENGTLTYFGDVEEALAVHEANMKRDTRGAPRRRRQERE